MAVNAILRQTVNVLRDKMHINPDKLISVKKLFSLEQGCSPDDWVCVSDSLIGGSSSAK